MKDVELHYKYSDPKNILLADGVTRSGKFLLGKILSSFHGVEFLQYSIALEQIPYLYGMNKIDEGAAIAILRSIVDYSVYDRYLGRNLNMRISDRSSIFNSSNFDKYLQRQYVNKSNDEVIKFMSDAHRKHLFVTHNILANINILMKAYTNISVIHIVRNPIDLAYSWFKKGYGRPGSIDGLCMNSDISIHDVPFPWFTKDWDADYTNLNEVDMVIRLIKSIYDCINNELNCLSKIEKEKILIIQYESLIINTDSTIKKISSFLGTDASEGMNETLVKERCPNLDILEKHDMKESIIFGQATDEYIEILKNMQKNYNLGIYF